MMKLFFCSLLLTITLCASAYESMPYRAPYAILADTFDSSIPAGSCVVFGVSFFQSGLPLQYGTVATLNRSAQSISDAKGKYELTISSNDSAIFFYHPEHGEIVIWNYDFKSQHRVEINLYPLPKYDEIQMVKKPVIYLYSDLEMQVELTLQHPHITFTYPQYNESWRVKTLANGSVCDLSSQKIYPYLFWEGQTKNLCYQNQNGKISGQLIKTDTLLHFLEASLSKLGLNQKEQTDFITFWAPSMVAENFVFIQFLIDEAYDAHVAGLTVLPALDNRRRIFMQFTLMENEFVPFEYSTQEFSTFNRSGFTLVEWGGSEIDFVTEVN